MNSPANTPTHRSRATKAWRSRNMNSRWWSDEPQSMSGWKAVGQDWSIFNIFDLPKRARIAIVVLSILGPAIALTTSQKVREHCERALPQLAAQRLAQTGKASIKDVTTLYVACKKSGDNPTLLRALATAVHDTDPAQARLCFDRIQQLHASTPADHAAHATLLARLDDFAGAKAVLAMIPREAQSGANVLRAWLALMEGSRNFEGAEKILEQLEKIAPDDANAFLTTATAAVRGKAAPEIAIAIERRALNSLLRCLTHSTLKDAPAVAGQIVQLSLKDPVNRAEAAEILRHLPGLATEHRMAAVRLEHPLELSGIAHDHLCSAYRNELMSIGGLSARDKDGVAKYLQGEGEHALVVELIGLQESYTERALFERRMDSMLHLGQWRAAADIVAAASTPEIPQSRRLYETLKSIRHLPAGHPVAANMLPSALDEAIESQKSVACYAVGCMALDNGLKSLACDAFSAATDLAGSDLQLVDGVISTSRRAGLAAADVLHAMSQHASPKDEQLQDRLCYLRLLAGRELDSAHDYIAARRQQTPEAPYLKMLDALHQHKIGNFVQSMQTLVPLPAYRWHQGEAAVLAAIIATAGKFDQSSILLNQVDVGQLFPEEKAMIEPWRTRMTIDKSLLGVVTPTANPEF